MHGSMLVWLALAAALQGFADIPRDDVRVGVTRLSGEQTRTHAFAEIIFVANGTVEWTQGTERFTADEGTVVLVPPNTVHTLGSTTGAELVLYRWAPGGDLSALHRGSTMTEPVETPDGTRETVDVRRYQPGPGTNRGFRTHIDDIDWTTNFTYSEELWKVYRYKPLVREALIDWSGVERADVRMGLQELDASASYPSHHHLSPEIYVVLSGTARWTVGETTIDAKPGTAVYTPPDTPHRIENTGSGALRWLYFWWAPDGDVTVFEER